MHLYFTAQPWSFLDATLKKQLSQWRQTSLSYLPARFATPQVYRIGLPHTKWGQKYEHYLHACSHSAPSPSASLEVPTSVYLLDRKTSLMQLWIHFKGNNLVTVSPLLGTSVLVTYLTSLLFNIHSPFTPFTITLKSSFQRWTDTRINKRLIWILVSDVYNFTHSSKGWYTGKKKNTAENRLCADSSIRISYHILKDTGLPGCTLLVWGMQQKLQCVTYINTYVYILA